MTHIRTRFAPSPTGFLHVGGIRTALFAYLVAKQAGGTFVLRLEDTDKSREVAGSREHLIASLKALRLDFDEGPDIGGDYGPYVQSERLDIYKQYAQKLIDAGLAYGDPFTPAEIQAFREQATLQKRAFRYRDNRPENPPAWDGTQPLRFKSTPKSYTYRDQVMGEITTSPEVIDDIILIKSDGYPTYNFAHIVDDLEMKITHVIRGQEFISSMANYLALYEALGFDVEAQVTLASGDARRGSTQTESSFSERGLGADRAAGPEDSDLRSEAYDGSGVGTLSEAALDDFGGEGASQKQQPDESSRATKSQETSAARVSASAYETETRREAVSGDFGGENAMQEAPLPIFAHLPHIMNEQGNKKLGKRDGAKDVLDYIRDGYLPETLDSFIATLGWNDGTEQEVFTMDELVEKFSLSRVQRSGARFDEKRLLWMNGHFIRELTLDELYKRVEFFWPEVAKKQPESYKKQVLALAQERLKTLKDLPALTSYFFEEPTRDDELITSNKQLKKLSEEERGHLLQTSYSALEKLEDWSAEAIQATLNQLLEATDQKPGILFSLIRIAITWAPFSPQLDETLAHLGKERALSRISSAIR